MGLENQIIILGKVALAILLGGLIGLERETIGKPAGMRTHMLIAGASTLFAALGSVIINYFGEVTCGTDLVRSDPIRVIQAIALGISFIGAGTIMQHPERRKVIYLTSAASILFTAGVGIAVAVDQFFLAVGCVAIGELLRRRSIGPDGRQMARRSAI